MMSAESIKVTLDDFKQYILGFDPSATDGEISTILNLTTEGDINRLLEVWILAQLTVSDSKVEFSCLEDFLQKTSNIYLDVLQKTVPKLISNYSKQLNQNKVSKHINH